MRHQSPLAAGEPRQPRDVAVEDGRGGEFVTGLAGGQQL